MMIPHLIDLICRGASLAALAWAVFSMGFASAERKTVESRVQRQPDTSEVGPNRVNPRFSHHG